VCYLFYRSKLRGIKLKGGINSRADTQTKDSKTVQEEPVFTELQILQLLGKSEQKAHIEERENRMEDYG
jgi:hypothetical protein